MHVTMIGIVFLGTLTLSAILTPAVRQIALKTNIVDRPGFRKKHLLTTPLLGGLSIYLAFGIALLAGIVVLKDPDGNMTSLSFKSLFPLVILGGGLMALVGLVDDILSLSPVLKLVFHTVAALAVGYIFIVKGTLLNIFLTGSGFAWLAAPLTILWLVGITNSLNLLDHADGLAAGSSTVAAIFFMIINLLSGNYPVAFISAALAGASAGFLIFNYNPASIFMGDCGSNMLGFVLGIIAVLGVYTPEGSIREIAVLAPLLVLSIPLVDTVFVLNYRRKIGKPLFCADRNHLAHRLMRLGLSHSQAVIVLLVIAILMGILALLLPTLKPYQAVLVLAHALGLIGLLAFFINRAEKRKTQ